MTDSIYYYHDNQKLTYRYYDLFHGDIHVKKEEESADEIIESIMTKGGLKFERI